MRRTKAQLESELASAQEKIAALQSELAAHEENGDDAVDSFTWGLLRCSVAEWVGEKATRSQVVEKATEIVRLFDALPNDYDERLQATYPCETKDIGEAMELRDNWVRSVGDTDALHNALWREGVLNLNDDLWEVFAELAR